MSESLTNELKREIIEQEISQYKAQSYRLQLRHKVAEKLGKKQQMELVEKDMVNVEAALDLLREEMKTLDGATPDA